MTEEHIHLHTHADGSVHNHYHQHVDGATHVEPKHTHQQDAALAKPKSAQRRDATLTTLTTFAELGHTHYRDAYHKHDHTHHKNSQRIIEAKGLTFRYGQASSDTFNNLSVEGLAGSVLAILGNNGAGKSTLLNVLATALKPSSGQIKISGIDLFCANRLHMSKRDIAKHIAYVTQEHKLPHLSVYDQVLLGRKPYINWAVTAYDRHVVEKTLMLLGLESYAERYTDELSGGERQKVHLARAIAQEPEVLLLDEPTSALDPKNQLEVLDTIRKITLDSSVATIVVMHDINLALRFCDRFLLLHDGKVEAYGNHSVVNDVTLSKTYGFALRLHNVAGTQVALPI